MSLQQERAATLIAEQLLTPPQTARSLGVSDSWLAKARLRGDGPRYVKIGTYIRA